MPITIRRGSFKYKDPNGSFTDIDCIKGEDYELTAQDKQEIAGMVNALVTDVQVNGTSVLSGGVANVPVASSNAIKAGAGTNVILVPSNQHAAVFYGLAKVAGSEERYSELPRGQYTESAKSAIHTMLNGSVSVTGTTPTITALPGIRYICGEVSTLGITLPDSGCIDVTFTSGATATVLTITPPTGQTVKWTNEFDPTSLDANTTYEINIMDGLGVVGAWT